MGDMDLHHFRHKWSEVTASITDKLTHETLADILAKKLESSHELEGDMEH